MLLQGWSIALGSHNLINQLIVILVVIDFWLTKNVNGKNLIGLRWSFDNDRWGVQRFKVQGYTREGLLDETGVQMFWLISIIYVALPTVFLLVAYIIIPSVQTITLRAVILNCVIVTGGVSNIFFFLVARKVINQRRVKVRRLLTDSVYSKMEESSIVAYY